MGRTTKICFLFRKTMWWFTLPHFLPVIVLSCLQQDCIAAVQNLGSSFVSKSNSNNMFLGNGGFWSGLVAILFSPYPANVPVKSVTAAQLHKQNSIGVHHSSLTFLRKKPNFLQRYFVSESVLCSPRCWTSFVVLYSNLMLKTVLVSSEYFHKSQFPGCNALLFSLRSEQGSDHKHQ